MLVGSDGRGAVGLSGTWAGEMEQLSLGFKRQGPRSRSPERC